MKKQASIFILAALMTVALAFHAQAAWESIAPGFEYQKITQTGPIEAFVTRMSRDSSTITSCTLDSMLAQGQLYKSGLIYGGRETVSSMVNRYNGAINYYWQTWGQTNDIVAAVNGDYWEREYYPDGPYTGRPQGGQVQSGWFIRRFPEYSGGSGAFYTIWGVPHIGGDVINGGGAARQKIIFADSSNADITALNVERGTDALAIYTPHWASSTHTDTTGVEVLVRLNRPLLPLPNGTSAFVDGTILQVRDGQGDTPIAFDQCVVSGTGSGATLLRSKCSIGQTIKFQMIIKDYGFDSRTPVHPPQDWTKAYGSIGVDREVLIDSQITNLPSPDSTRDPRTAVAFNADYVFLIVIDGRSSYSVGMTFGELSAFCRDTLSATHAASLDGGGSSCMWVKGKGIVNRPSDGSERATVNGFMMVSVQGKRQSCAFSGGQPVKAWVNTVLRSGPGTDYPLVASISVGQEGFVVDHSLNGLSAKGQNWVKWSTGTAEGWTPEYVFYESARVHEWDSVE